MADTWLILDTPYLAWRSFFSLPSFENDGIRTQVLFGVFQAITYLREYFSTNKFIFCFDAGCEKRREIYPEYKLGRQKKYELMGEEEKQSHAEMRKQVALLEHKYLPRIGFRNIFSQTGYEADDMVAVACSRLRQGDDAVIVSSDQDLFQLLRDDVRIWNPAKKKIIDKKAFCDEYGVEPSQWADVKAIAGCTTDEVPGVDGVGEKYAARFLTGSLKSTTKAYQSIVAGNSVWRRNLDLVRLPFPGATVPQFQQDEVTRISWDDVMERLGMRTMMRSV